MEKDVIDELIDETTLELVKNYKEFISKKSTEEKFWIFLVGPILEGLFRKDNKNKA